MSFSVKQRRQRVQYNDALIEINTVTVKQSDLYEYSLKVHPFIQRKYRNCFSPRVKYTREIQRCLDLKEELEYLIISKNIYRVLLDR